MHGHWEYREGSYHQPDVVGRREILVKAKGTEKATANQI